MRYTFRIDFWDMDEVEVQRGEFNSRAVGVIVLDPVTNDGPHRAPTAAPTVLGLAWSRSVSRVRSMAAGRRTRKHRET